MSRAELLDDYLAGWRERPFSWPSSNCTQFAAGWVQAATGARPLAGVVPPADKRDAARTVRRLGGTLTAAVTRQMGSEPIEPNLAHIGDVVLLCGGPAKAPAVGICCGRLAAAMTVEDGLAWVPMEHAAHAWRVGA